MRDAHQSLFATRMLTADMVSVASLMDGVGYWSLETWGGATFDTCIRFLNEDPWDRLKRLQAAMPHTPQQMLLRGQNLVGYRHYADDVVDAFVACAARHGVAVFRVFDALNDPRNLESSIRAVKRAGKHAQATISYAVSPVHTLDAYIQLARELKALGADSLCIKDMAGLLKPYDAEEMVKALRREIGLPLQIHTHATTGMSVATLVKAIEAGCERIDTAISSLAMGTSHSPTETIVEVLRGTPYDTGLDVKVLVRIAAAFRALRGKYRQFESSFLGADTRILTSQVPGGMLSNLESQLREQNALGKLDAVLDEIAVVQRDFGYPPLVTPTSQIVGTQAVFNVLFGRYARLTGESKDLLVGRYGRTPAAPDAALIRQSLADLKLDVPVTARPADHLPNEFGQLEEELKTKLKVTHVSPEDVLTYAMFPQVALKFFGTRHKGPVTFEAPAADPAPAPAAGAYTVTVNGKAHRVTRRPGTDGTVTLQVGGRTFETRVQAEAAGSPAPSTPAVPAAGARPLPAPMPGSIVRLECDEGASVAAGATVVIMEAMKMQIEIKTREAGVIRFKVGPGDAVKAEQTLAVIE
jgi:oxaloacetate decarboxylase alpha subunit